MKTVCGCEGFVILCACVSLLRPLELQGLFFEFVEVSIINQTCQLSVVLFYSRTLEAKRPKDSALTVCSSTLEGGSELKYF